MYFTVVSGDHHILSVSVAKQQIFKTDMSIEVSVTVFVQIHICCLLMFIKCTVYWIINKEHSLEAGLTVILLLYSYLKKKTFNQNISRDHCTLLLGYK